MGEVKCFHVDLEASVQLQWTVSVMPVSLSTSHSVSFDFFSPRSLESVNKLSNLRQHDLEGVCVALDAEDEGVFVGVVLNDVIVHVHQDPAAKTAKV